MFSVGPTGQIASVRRLRRPFYSWPVPPRLLLEEHEELPIPFPPGNRRFARAGEIQPEAFSGLGNLCNRLLLQRGVAYNAALSDVFAADFKLRLHQRKTVAAGFHHRRN